MALQPFNYYFFSGAGSITVNGTAPAASYEEGTSLTIDVTFSDGSTAVEWIVNNASAGTTDPLVINMPSGGIYLRIIGSGAPPVTNQFRFFWRFGNGQGFLTVNGSTSPDAYYEAGTELELEVSFVPGFTFEDFNVNNGLFIGGTNPYTFTMPSADVDVTINSTGIPTYVDNHGLRYYAEFCDLTGQALDLEILELDYEGEAEKRICTGVSYSWGDFGANILKAMVYSSVKFSLIGERDEFFPLLDGGARYWKLRIKIDGVLFWEGYLSNSILGVSEVSHIQAQMFTAIDGLKSLEAIRAIDSYFPRIASGFEMMTALVRCMNQTFDNARVSHVACSIYETRLDRSIGLFEQLLVPDNAVYKDGEQPVYVRNGGGEVELNTSLYISEILERCLEPFMCRIFLWKNEFYIISTPELNKPSYTIFDYDTFGDADGTRTISEGLNLSCKFTNGQRTGKPVYTEFTTILKLGVLDEAARGGLIEYKFGDVGDWILLTTGSPYSGTYQLKNWKYVRAIPSGQPEEWPFGDHPALIQYAEQHMKIWGTTSDDGIDDPNISYIEIDTYRNKNPIQVAQGIANTLAFKIEFMGERRGSAVSNIPSNQRFGVMIQVGAYYMTWDGNQTFGWDNTFNVMRFPILNLYSWNSIDILPLEIPSDGIVTVRIYEVITTGPVIDGYGVSVKNMSLKIEQNEAFVLEEIQDKFITTDQYSNVYPPINVYIGDVRSENSTSAIKLNIPEYDYPPSSLWSIDGETEIRLSQIILQEAANLFGQPNPRLVAIALRDGVNPLEVVPFQNVVYDNAYWMVVAIDLDFQLNTWRIELHRLDGVES